LAEVNIQTITSSVELGGRGKFSICRTIFVFTLLYVVGKHSSKNRGYHLEEDLGEKLKIRAHITTVKNVPLYVKDWHVI